MEINQDKSGGEKRHVSRGKRSGRPHATGKLPPAAKKSALSEITLVPFNLRSKL
jgi:hypothetical protein